MSKEEQLRKLWEIHQVEGFDPAAFAVEYTDMNTGEQRKRLPVMIQMAWFRLKYPEGRIAVEVTSAKDSFVAKARVYPSYKDGPECYLAEATASRGPDPAHPTVSPREWAQTAAVGVALRNAGFGLQLGAVGEDFSQNAPDELPPQEETPAKPAGKKEPGPEEQLRQAMNTRQVQGENPGGYAHPGPRGHRLGDQKVPGKHTDWSGSQTALRLCPGADCTLCRLTPEQAAS